MPAKAPAPPAILFVCLGNICRSPLAEGAMRRAAERMGTPLTIDSAGTGGWHTGDPPDSRAIAIAAAHGVDIAGQRARPFVRADFDRFDHIVAMDRSNLARLVELAPPHSRATLSLLLDHVPGRAGQEVADPYHGGVQAFARTWADVVAGTDGLVVTLAQNPLFR